jgi:hypothetical protein
VIRIRKNQTAVGALSESNLFPCQLLVLYFGGSLAKSGFDANAYPEYAVPKSMAATNKLLPKCAMVMSQNITLFKI